MRKSFFLIPFLVLLILACDEDVFYTSSLEIPDAKWNYDYLLNYEVEVKDTSMWYDLVLDVLHSPDYDYQNLYVNIRTAYPDGDSRQQQLSIDMAAPTGQWYGKCNKSRCELRVVLQENAFFDQQGLHQFQIEQYMRENPITGIYSLSFSIFPVGSLRR